MNDLLFIPIEDVKPNRYALRRVVEVESLAEDIKKNGLINPITVREILEDGKTYEVAQGDRRLQAYRLLAGNNPDEYSEIPAFVRKFKTEVDFLVFSISENVQRRDITWLETAEALIELEKQSEGKSWADIATLVGFSYDKVRKLTSIANRLETETKDLIYECRAKKSSLREEILAREQVERILSQATDDAIGNTRIRAVIEQMVNHEIDFNDAYPLIMAVSTKEEADKIVEVAEVHKVAVSQVAKAVEEIGTERATKAVERAAKHKPTFKQDPDIEFWVAVEKEESERLGDVKRSVEAVEERKPKEMSKEDLAAYQQMRPLSATETVKRYVDESIEERHQEEMFGVFFRYEEWRRKNKLKIEGKERW